MIHFFIFCGHGIENNKIILSDGKEIHIDFIQNWFDGNEDHIPSLLKSQK